MRRTRIILASLTLLAGISLNMSVAGALPLQLVADLKSDACKGLTQVDPTQDCANPQDPIENITSTIVNILSVVVGAAAVIMIILSGFRYIVSGGDSNKVSAAKTALIYALVGLAIAGLAQFLVHFVLHNASSAVHS